MCPVGPEMNRVIRGGALALLALACMGGAGGVGEW